MTWKLALPHRGRSERRQLELDRRPRVMGVLNLTPDSFSDGGLWIDPERAVAYALEMLAAGAELLDLGAESTRPGGGVYGEGAVEVAADAELARLLPVLEALRRRTDAALSIDTRKGEVARHCLAAGADLINDVAGGADPELLAAVAEAGCPLVLMHSRGELRTMQRQIGFDDVVSEVGAELASLAERAQRAGVPGEQLILDPGIGFGKTAAQNLQILRQVETFDALGRPLLVGASRKSFIAAVCPAPPDRRLGGSLAAVAAACRGGAAIVRVHDVAETVQFLRVREAILEA